MLVHSLSALALAQGALANEGRTYFSGVPFPGDPNEVLPMAASFGSSSQASFEKLSNDIVSNVEKAALKILNLAEETTGNSDNDGKAERTITLQGSHLQELPTDIFQISDDYFVDLEYDEFTNEISGPPRWTEASRPWTKNYSQFRRTIKVLLNETLSTPFYNYGRGEGQMLGPNVQDNKGRQTRYPKAVNTIPKIMRNYGCWCMPRGDRDWANGHGRAVDAVDEVCKSFGHCLTCTQMEGNCFEITDTAYAHEIKFNQDVNPPRMQLVCKDNVDPNPTDNAHNDCMKKSCECQAHNIDKIMVMALNVLEEERLAWSNGDDTIDTVAVINPEFSQKTKFFGSFEFETCKRGQLRSDQNQITHTPEHCCGFHPTWKVFDSQSGARKCCGSKLYYHDSQVCSCQEPVNGPDSCSLEDKNML